MQRTAILLGCLTLSACAGAYKSAYVTGAAVKQFVTEAHDIYDDEANVRLSSCDPERNAASTVKTQSDFDACMGAAYTVEAQTGVVQALAVYRVAAVAFSAVMLGCEPPADPEATIEQVKASCVKRIYTDAELRSWRSKLVDTAIDALAQFPDAEAKVQQLKGLIR